MNKNRSQEEIIANILVVAKKEPKKTHIMYKANLSYSLLNKYLTKLIEGRLIDYRKNNKVYKLTEKGEAYLRSFSEYKSLKNQLEIYKSSLNQKETNLNKMLKV